MAQLRTMKIEAIRANSVKVSRAELAEFKPQVKEWKIVTRKGEQHLERAFKFKNFAEALAFTVKVGKLADKVDHHPTLLTEWGRVTVNWWTHKIGALHRNDFIMAAKTDTLYEGK